MIAQTETDRESMANSNTGSRIWAFDRHIYICYLPILKVKIRVIHLSLSNISETVTVRTQTAIENKYKVAYEVF